MAIIITTNLNNIKQLDYDSNNNYCSVNDFLSGY
jgi:hypothetical protein